ncbi:MAG: cytochrome c biosis protein, partial [Candidatus Eremiobacteraeota bacterium]|nr:cytochrome c biosis protein [Candidatus Eremiobacteraeota bacterium]
MEARSGSGVARTGALGGLRESWDETVRLFANVTFGVSLLAVWGFLTLIGVVIDQGKDAATYAGEYAPSLARLIVRLDLGNIYHSAAYLGILGLILCSMTAATFTKVIPRRIPRLNPVKIDAIPLSATVTVAGDAASAGERVAAFFAGR